MRLNWSVLMRRLKTPLNDSFQKCLMRTSDFRNLDIDGCYGSFQFLFHCWRSSRYGPSQADVASFKGLKEQPNPAKYPNAYRWYKHISSYESEFSSLAGDPSKAYTTYGPEKNEATLNPKDAPSAADAEEEEEEEEEDLFGSDEEEDAEAVRIREENLAAYKKKKEGKTKPAAKSIVTLDVKPWGMVP